ncbi:MAG TPA: hypothetical protein VK668_01680 [Mucilaginibacter sp.]|nr:hypothetical protein [Mucilaginibacter sp.]
MKKFLILLLILLTTPLIAGLYGIIHDQFTYTISHEYFTKFKFYQFGLVDTDKEAILPNPRIAVAAVGFMATWWTGIIIGIGHGLTGLIQRNASAMLNVVVKATLITLIITALSGLIGLCYGKFYLAYTDVNWWFPDNLIDKKAFIAVGSMHNFSYLGGLVGLIAGMGYQIFKARHDRKILYRNH